MTPPNVGMNEDGPLKGPAARQSGISPRRSGPAGQPQETRRDRPFWDSDDITDMEASPAHAAMDRSRTRSPRRDT